ncbi:MAG TPA: sugar phosphate isomerase/epimerase family protein [Terriglobia bacterium]|nr:sugar phosphate isomerase/epimerase family protein [Terriglobia bacterium]
MFITRRDFLLAAGVAGIAIPALASVDGIQLGVCASTSELEVVAQYGFDYIEPPAASVAGMSDAGFQAFKTKVMASPIRCECFNSFIRRKDLRVVGDSVNMNALMGYIDPTLARCRDLGGSIVVWGSAGSRNVPPGFSREKAWGQIREFLGQAGDIARRHQIIIAIEPLRHQESNIINTGAEALQLVHEVNHPNIKMIIDYYHMRIEHENPEIVWTARQKIVHFHFANPHGRLWPKSPAEDPMYAEFFKQVKRIHFHGGISIEGRGSLAQDGAASLAFFRQEITSA